MWKSSTKSDHGILARKGQGKDLMRLYEIRDYSRNSKTVKQLSISKKIFVTAGLTLVN